MFCTFRFYNWKTQIHKIFSSLSLFPLLCWDFLPMQSLTHVLKLSSVILQFIGIFDMVRLYVSRWAFIFWRLTKLQEKKILSGCFKFKATDQKFRKSGLLFLETLNIVYSILQCSLRIVLGLSSYYHNTILVIIFRNFTMF